MAVRDPGRDRGLPLAADRFTDDAGAVVDDPTIDIICELMGGVEPARELLVRALASGKSVVTANKELLASHGEAVHRRRGGRRRSLFRGSRGRRHPLIRPLRESLAGERVDRILGIVNGTTNFILTQMSEHGWTADGGRRGAATRVRGSGSDRRRGGYDAAAKCAILASVAFGARSWPTTSTARISAVTPQDFRDAARLGYVIKLLAIAELDDEAIAVRVHPAMIPDVHPSPRFGARRTRSSSRDRRSGS